MNERPMNDRPAHSNPNSASPANERGLAISILQNARDRLGERLTSRIVEAREEIEADADGGSYLSEIETIYEQLGSRLAHLNAMLSNLPPDTGPLRADATATEIIYADLASAYPTGFEVEPTPAANTMLALPAPAGHDAPASNALGEAFSEISALAHAGEHAAAAQLISECFDLRPTQARRWAVAFARQISRFPDLPRRLTDLAGALSEANEHAAAALVAECFESQAIEALALVRALRQRLANSDAGR